MHTPFLNRSLGALTFIGDILCYYLALAAALTIRYGGDGFTTGVFNEHQNAFTYGLLLWLIVFYIGGLYERQSLIQKLLDRRFFITVFAGGVSLILMFYFVPAFGITPKTNLLLFIVIYAAIGYGWRMMVAAMHRGALKRGGGVATLLVGESQAAEEIWKALSQENSSGYRPVYWCKSSLEEYKKADELMTDIHEGRVHVIVTPLSLERDSKTLRLLYEATLAGCQIISVSDFYERIFEKVSLSTLDEVWSIHNLASRRLRYQPLKRAGECLGALILLVITSPLLLLGALLVTLTSRGGALYRQTRVGFDGKLFKLAKLRTMYADNTRNPDAEGAKPLWTLKNDARITPVGRFLRATHIDELPQLFNILGGTMSFVGPRPERPEFTRELEKSIPYYELRYLATPGIAGWAQLHFRYGASVSDAYQKLQYDVFYIKHRSFVFDLTITLKTIKRFFSPAHE